MDWNNRGPNPPQNNNSAPINNNIHNPSPNGPAPSKRFMPPALRRGNKHPSKLGSDERKWRVASVVLLFTITLLAISVIAYLAFFRPSAKSQSEYVDSTKYQAVFLNGGQVYFGKITTVNGSYTKLADIYYLRVNQQVQPNAQSSSNGGVQLVKLGCELHGPQDQMVINSEQVVFWENLKDDGQVAQAISKYTQENPEGQKCQTQTNNSSENTTTPTTENNQ